MHDTQSNKEAKKVHGKGSLQLTLPVLKVSPVLAEKHNTMTCAAKI